MAVLLIFNDHAYQIYAQKVGKTPDLLTTEERACALQQAERWAISQWKQDKRDDASLTKDMVQWPF